ncbi:MAG: tetratricopeptide repeat protein [Proteobacteria bacterium]|nr:tetratricopeptide repeat protein [Pseudomonadota bacterium]
MARAGTGKTRLAIELCERAEASGWNAGFARADELRRFFDHRNLSDWRWNEKALIVVDYAAASATALRQWQAVLARHPPCAHPLRLLLLERHADAETGWWAELARPGGMSGRGPESLLDPAGPIVLASLRAVEDRRALFAQAMAEAVRVLRPAVVPVLPAPGTDAAFERRLADDTINNEPLFLLMAGLVALTTGAPAALSFSRIDLALRVAEAERDRLDRLATAAGIDPVLFRHLAACATLQGGCDTDAAVRMVEAERAAIGDRSSLRTDALVGYLGDALPLPGSGDVDAVRPDLIGEAFLWQYLSGGHRKLDAQCAVVARAFARAGTPVATTVIHAAQDLAAGSAGHATVAWLDHLASRTDDIATLMAIADELPEQTLALRERAAEITARLTDLLRAEVARAADLLPLLAGWLNNLSIRLSALGRRETALAVIEEAVAIYRTFTAEQANAFRSDLAVSLNNRSNNLSALGRREAALPPIEEAVAITRALAVERPDPFRRDLAISLTNLSARLSDLGQPEAALAAVEEAGTIYRTLAAARPDASRPDLALSLCNQSNCLSALGRQEAALAAIEDAVTIYRDLAAKRPDAFRPELARSLNNLSNRLSGLGRWKAALAAIEDAVAIYRVLAAERPDAFRPSLAAALNNLSVRLYALGQREAALAAVEEAGAIYHALAAVRPDAFRPELARSLNNLSVCLSDLGRREAALAAVEEAVATTRALAAERPDAFRRDLASALNNLSHHLSALGWREAALPPIEEAAAIIRALVAGRPDAFRPDLARALSNMSNRLSDVGRPHAALETGEEAVLIYRALAAERPDAFHPDLARALKDLANHLSAVGRREATLPAADEAVAIYRALAAAQPDTFRPDLAVSLCVLAGHLDETGDPPAGVAANAEAIAVLTPAFLLVPAAFAPRMEGMVREYVERCEKLKRAPDADLLAPVLAAFASLQNEQGQPP